MKTKEDIKIYAILCVLSILSLVILFAVGNRSLQKAPNLSSMNIDVTDSEVITDATSTEILEEMYNIELESFVSDTTETTGADEVTTKETECVETDSEEATYIEETAAQSILETICVPEETDTSANNDYGYYTENDIILCAKVLRGECNGMSSDTEIACVIWVVLNRVDYNPGCTIADVITAPSQFAYHSNAYVDDRFYQIASDVLSRWAREKQGEQNVGRVLPIEYRWFHGDGHHNWFRTQYEGNGQYWDYSLPSPYDT